MFVSEICFVIIVKVVEEIAVSDVENKKSFKSLVQVPNMFVLVS